MTLLLPVAAAVLLSFGSVLIFRAVWASDVHERPQRRTRHRSVTAAGAADLRKAA